MGLKVRPFVFDEEDPFLKLHLPVPDKMECLDVLGRSEDACLTDDDGEEGDDEDDAVADPPPVKRSKSSADLMQMHLGIYSSDDDMIQRDKPRTTYSSSNKTKEEAHTAAAVQDKEEDAAAAVQDKEESHTAVATKS